MNKYLRSYIDHQIIAEHAKKDLSGYELDIKKLPKHEQTSLLEVIATGDPEFKEMVLDYAQHLIDIRLPIVEMEDRYNEGYRPSHDDQTGEVSWVPQRAGGY